jgi:molecular chaperone GrpE (heat shock protein)
MEAEAVLEANKNLNKKIEKLEAELKLCWIYKEKYDQAHREIKGLRDDLFRKRNTVRVVRRDGDINYVLQITKLVDSSEGLFIEVA